MSRDADAQSDTKTHPMPIGETRNANASLIRMRWASKGPAASTSASATELNTKIAR